MTDAVVGGLTEWLLSRIHSVRHPKPTARPRPLRNDFPGEELVSGSKCVERAVYAPHPLVDLH